MTPEKIIYYRGRLADPEYLNGAVGHIAEQLARACTGLPAHIRPSMKGRERLKKKKNNADSGRAGILPSYVASRESEERRMESLFVQNGKKTRGIGYFVKSDKGGAKHIRITLPESAVYQASLLGYVDVMTDGKKVHIQKAETGFFVAHVAEDVFRIDIHVSRARGEMICGKTQYVATWKWGEGYIEFELSSPGERVFVMPEPPSNDPNVDAMIEHRHIENDDDNSVEPLLKKRGRPSKAKSGVFLDGERNISDGERNISDGERNISDGDDE
jgi:hypothetical protein